MKLSELAKKPKLIEVSIEDPETIEQYGEPVVFHMYDRMPLSMFVKMAAVDPENTGAIVNIVKDIVLDEKGKPLIDDDTALPVNLMMKVITVAVGDLGK